MTVAAGAFAPGHLGELTRCLPFELVDDVLEMTGAVQRRMRMLPSRAGVYVILAMTLFPGIGYLRVWDKMTAALEGLELPRPSEKALREPGCPRNSRPGRPPSARPWDSSSASSNGCWTPTSPPPRSPCHGQQRSAVTN